MEVEGERSSKEMALIWLTQYCFLGSLTQFLMRPCKFNRREQKEKVTGH